MTEEITMSTTIVNRGAGRPAAAAKTLKHAQRTSLPPRGAVSGWDGGGAAEILIQESRALRARIAAEREAAAAAATLEPVTESVTPVVEAGVADVQEVAYAPAMSSTETPTASFHRSASLRVGAGKVVHFGHVGVNQAGVAYKQTTCGAEGRQTNATVREIEAEVTCKKCTVTAERVAAHKAWEVEQAAAEADAIADSIEVDLDAALALVAEDGETLEPVVTVEDDTEDDTPLAATESAPVAAPVGSVSRSDGATAILPKKILALADLGSEHGWTVEITTDTPIVSILAVRSSERIEIRYLNGVITPENAKHQRYTRSDGTIVLLRNASAARRQMTSDLPPIARERAGRVEVVEEPEMPRKTVDAALLTTPTAGLVEFFMTGRTITYRPTGGRGTHQTCVLPAGRGAYRIERSLINSAPSARIIHLVDADNTYRMISLASLISVDALGA